MPKSDLKSIMRRGHTPLLVVIFIVAAFILLQTSWLPDLGGGVTANSRGPNNGHPSGTRIRRKMLDNRADTQARLALVRQGLDSYNVDSPAVKKLIEEQNKAAVGYKWPTPPPPPPPPAPPAPDWHQEYATFPNFRSNCGDVTKNCWEWQEWGECTNNPLYMYFNCGYSCGVCSIKYNHNPPKKIEIAPNVWMPTVGFGTAGLMDWTKDTVLQALRAGYRLLDTAQAREWYREDLVGDAILMSGMKREELFITSKLHPGNLGYWNTLYKVQDTLKDLNTTYVDLFLIHYPYCWDQICGKGYIPEGTWETSWRALEELVDEGSIRAIGVSNFNIVQLAELMSFARIKPAVVQAHSDPFRHDRETQTFCRKHGIHYQGYSTIGGQWVQVSKDGTNPILTDGTIGSIAAAYKKTPAQVVLRWALQHNQSVIPRTTREQRMYSNLDLFDFDLNDQDMQEIDLLDGTSPWNY